LSELMNLGRLYLNNNPLNRDAYCIYMALIFENNPDIYLYYDPNPNPPLGVSASDGTYPDKVRITWDAVCSGPGYDSYYQVYRSDSAEGEKSAISEWRTATKYDDTTVEHGATYHYWVSAATDAVGSDATDCSSCDEGRCSVAQLLTISSGPGGHVETPGEGSFWYMEGTVVPVKAVAEPDYYFMNWTGTAVSEDKVGEPNSASTMVAVDGYSALRANFVCFTPRHGDFLEWLSVGKPACWCYKRQCHGDADGQRSGSEKTGYYYVGPPDLNILVDAWLVREPPCGPGIASVPNGICADFAHDTGGSAKRGYYRVGPSDLNILIANRLVREPPHSPGIRPDCLDSP
jgi:hypothetical protein